MNQRRCLALLIVGGLVALLASSPAAAQVASSVLNEARRSPGCLATR